MQTKDHPLEYDTFEGTIPAGQCEGGTVAIWDTDHHELEKWCSGNGVIITLTGRRSSTPAARTGCRTPEAILT